MFLDERQSHLGKVLKLKSFQSLPEVRNFLPLDFFKVRTEDLTANDI